jgi:hypothetical protein
MRAPTLLATVAVLAAPVPALAQDAEGTAAEVERKLGDPATQAAVAEGMAAASEALLDIPLAPLARAVAKAAGEDPERVDPDMTLRRVTPEADDVPERVREELPRVMGAMSGMAGSVGAMVPALREMAERMREAMERARPRN